MRRRRFHRGVHIVDEPPVPTDAVPPVNLLGVPQTHSLMDPAEQCRQNGWTVGTRLVGDEGYGPSVIEITAIGERLILAKRISPRIDSEATWTLGCRNWREVSS